MPATKTRPRTMSARYPGRCKSCWVPFPAGAEIRWLGRGKGAEHVDCASDDVMVHVDNRTWKQKYGRCEDAPCCGCCGTNLYGGTEW